MSYSKSSKRVRSYSKSSKRERRSYSKSSKRERRSYSKSSKRERRKSRGYTLRRAKEGIVVLCNGWWSLASGKHSDDEVCVYVCVCHGRGYVRPIISELLPGGLCKVMRSPSANTQQSVSYGGNLNRTPNQTICKEDGKSGRVEIYGSGIVLSVGLCETP